VKVIKAGGGSGSVVGTRLDALTRLVAAAQDRLPPGSLDPARDVLRRAADRFTLSAEHTVVILGGATGVGKSSLFNCLVGIGLSPVAVRRPTTTAAIACVWEAERMAEARPLLDRLGVDERRQLSRDSPLDRTAVRDALSGLVLVDLPDHDSALRDHQIGVDQAVSLADVLVWVTDPQKYADASWHDRYLKALSNHADVMLIVLNQIDRLAPEAVAECVADLTKLVEDDGLNGVPVIPVSARTREGVDDLRRELTDRVTGRRAVAERLAADVDRVAERLEPLLAVNAVAAAGGGTEAEAQEAQAGPGAAADRAAAAEQDGDGAPASAAGNAIAETVSGAAEADEDVKARLPDVVRAEVMEGLRASAAVASLADVVTALVSENSQAAVSSPLRSMITSIGAGRAGNLVRRLTGAAPVRSPDAILTRPSSVGSMTVRDLVRAATRPLAGVPGTVPVDRAALETVLARLADEVVAPLPEFWGRTLRDKIVGSRVELGDRIDAALANCRLDAAAATGSRPGVRTIHVLLLLAAGGGVVLALLVAHMRWAGLGLAVLALLASGVMDLAMRAVARRRANVTGRVAVGQLSVELAAVAQDVLFEPIAGELERFRAARADFEALRA
jgi:GTPase Era involved in 16S rRNA processing